ncbi:hypothetical protein LWI28_022206 [Acer negundo]|uniref:Gag protein n=1 Tax=Acer negundo TaxID=4023 RepID=A0AAD5P2U8_ACENE|nr:hypothetical protein LWI28_022206 [Acer negundo]
MTTIDESAKTDMSEVPPLNEGSSCQNEDVMSAPSKGEMQNIQPAYRLNGKNYFKWSQVVQTFLKGKGKELDHYRCIAMKCSDDAATLKNVMEQDQVYDFLAGLNVYFDQVRVQILGKDELPSLNSAISMVRAEESRRSVMLQSQPIDRSAMISK